MSKLSTECLIEAESTNYHIRYTNDDTNILQDFVEFIFNLDKHQPNFIVGFEGKHINNPLQSETENHIHINCNLEIKQKKLQNTIVRKFKHYKKNSYSTSIVRNTEKDNIQYCIKFGKYLYKNLQNYSLNDLQTCCILGYEIYKRTKGNKKLDFKQKVSLELLKNQITSNSTLIELYKNIKQIYIKENRLLNVNQIAKMVEHQAITLKIITDTQFDNMVLEQVYKDFHIKI